jgi:hypothetical protein
VVQHFASLLIVRTLCQSDAEQAMLVAPKKPANPFIKFMASNSHNAGLSYSASIPEGGCHNANLTFSPL